MGFCYCSTTVQKVGKLMGFYFSSTKVQHELVDHSARSRGCRCLIGNIYSNTYFLTDILCWSNLQACPQNSSKRRTRTQSAQSAWKSYEKLWRKREVGTICWRWQNCQIFNPWRIAEGCWSEGKTIRPPKCVLHSKRDAKQPWEKGHRF